MKIANRFFLYISSLIILTSVCLGYISVRDERLHLMSEARVQARTLAGILAATFKYYHVGEQDQQIGELIHAVMPHGQDVNHLLLNIYDRQGRRMDFAFEHGINKTIPRKSAVIGDMVTGSREELIKDGSHEYLSVIRPIINNAGELQGAVEVLLSLEQINRDLASLVRKFIAFILLTATLLGILIYFISRWSISLPIAGLIEASEKLGHGDLALRIDKSGVKELDNLIEEFNRMAYNIEQQSKKKDHLFAEKINLERSLRHSDKLASIGRLASGLAHEIGTPLNVISGRAEHLMGKLPEDHPGRETLQNIIRQSKRITRTMQQMLAFSRKSDIRFVEVDLEKTIREAFSLCQLKQRQAERQIGLELQLLETNILADEDGIRQLFVNLMLNSFHVLQDGGVILVRIGPGEYDPEIIKICYEDNGPGIPADYRDNIFDPFFTTKDVGEGTGLGLFVAANIVQEHHGSILLDTDFTTGARFIICLPQNPSATDRSDTVPALA